MMDHFFVTTPWWDIFLATVISLMILYFGIASAAQSIIYRLIVKSVTAKKINTNKPPREQRNSEIKRSVFSIFIFGLFGVITQQAYLHQIVNINWQINPVAILLEMIIIFLWNELHFYLCHRLLHSKWFFKNVHYIHHNSHIPSPWSAYSFHWFEAVLVSSVMIIAMLFYTFSYISLLFLPFISLFLNVLGHWDYDLFPRKKNDHLLRFSYRHSMHHKRVKYNYGFFLPWFDNLFHTAYKDKINNP